MYRSGLAWAMNICAQMHRFAFVIFKVCIGVASQRARSSVCVCLYKHVRRFYMNMQHLLSSDVRVNHC